MPLSDVNITINVENEEYSISEDSVSSVNRLNIIVTSNGEAVENGEVTVYVNEVALEPVTLTDGEVNVTVTLTQAGLNFVKVVYNPLEFYTAQVKSIPYIDVPTLNTVTTIEPVTAKIGENVNIIVTVTDNDGKNITSGSVKLYTPTENKTLIVENGLANYTTTITKEWMNSNISATFEKTSTLNASNCSIKPTINKGESSIVADYDIDMTNNTAIITVSVVDVNNNRVDENKMIYLKDSKGQT